MGGKRVAVLGGGSFGTALSTIAARAGNTVRLYARDPEQVKGINHDHRNPKYLKDYVIPEEVVATSDLAEACSDAQLIIHAVPTQRTVSFYEEHAEKLPPGCPIVSTSKGLLLKEKKLLSEVLPLVFEKKGLNNPICYLSGPSFAKEMMSASPTTVVVACTDEPTSTFVQETLASETFRLYRSTDIVGVQLGGALKNPIAIAAGVAEGLGYGTNTLAALVTRGCGEMQRLAEALGGRPETLSGLSGIGDLMLTSLGGLSRNKAVGRRIATGESVSDIVASMDEVAEGVPTAAVAAELAQRENIHAPIFNIIQKVLTEEVSARDAVYMLMTMPSGAE